jgi:hypothetical protein
MIVELDRTHIEEVVAYFEALYPYVNLHALTVRVGCLNAVTSAEVPMCPWSSYRRTHPLNPFGINGLIW